MKNLWPKTINETEHKITPKEFLNAQMNYLKDSTNGKLQGSISSLAANSSQDFQASEDYKGEQLFIHSMKIYSPSLSYSFTLLRLAHPTLKIYPFTVYSNLTSEKFTGNSIEKLEEILSNIFNKKEVVEALSALATQSEEQEKDNLPF
jgi:hypothetical protein